MAEIKVIEPAKSIFRSFSFHGRIECFRFGGLYITAMMRMARAPQAGKLVNFVHMFGFGGTYGGSPRNRIAMSALRSR